MIRIFLLTLMIEFKVPPSSSRAGIIPFVWIIFRLNLLSSINKGDDKSDSLRWIYIFIQIRQQHWDQKIWVWVLWAAAWSNVISIAFVWALVSLTSRATLHHRSCHQPKRFEIVNQWLVSWATFNIDDIMATRLWPFDHDHYPKFKMSRILSNITPDDMPYSQCTIMLYLRPQSPSKLQVPTILSSLPWNKEQ